MQVEAIGSNLTSATSGGMDNTSLTQSDFIKLFLAQLSFQDPLEPVDNAQFLAQMAQFSAVEQSRELNSKIDSLLSMNTVAQAASLVGKQVEIGAVGSSQKGKVTAVEFTENGPTLTVDVGAGNYVKDVGISAVRILTSIE